MARRIARAAKSITHDLNSLAKCEGESEAQLTLYV
jgi:hypothetical protein